MGAALGVQITDNGVPKMVSCAVSATAIAGNLHCFAAASVLHCPSFRGKFRPYIYESDTAWRTN